VSLSHSAIDLPLITPQAEAAPSAVALVSAIGYGLRARETTQAPQCIGKIPTCTETMMSLRWRLPKLRVVEPPLDRLDIRSSAISLDGGFSHPFLESFRGRRDKAELAH